MLNKQPEPEIPDRSEFPLRVLIVEDSPLDAELEIATLTRAGYVVRHEVAPTEEIFQQILSRADFDIILADYNLQNWTGLDALDILKKSGKNIPVVMVTGSLGDEAAVECIKEGAADYVLKDRVARLSLAVRRALKERDLLRDRTQAQEALRQSEERLRALIAGVSDYAIYMLDVDGRVLTWNPGAERIKGYTAEEIIGRNFSVFFLEEDIGSGKPQRALEAAAADGHFEDEGWRVRKDGSQFWAITALTALRNDQDQLRGFAKITRDITERKNSEEKLRESEERFRLISENVDDLIAVFDIEGNRLYSSPSYKKIFRDPGSLPGVFSVHKVHPDDQEKVRQVFQEMVRTGLGQRFEFRLSLDDGSVRQLEAQGSVIHGRQGKPTRVVVVSRDVTVRKALEAQLNQSQKMEAVGRLAGGVAHDFNNLLTIIGGFGQMLLDQLDPNDVRTGYLTEILKAGERAAALTRQLLAFSRQQVLAPRLVDLNELVINTEKMLRRLIGEDVELVTILKRGLGRVKADPGQIEQVIMNLVVNSRDAMPHGGRLTIETCNVDLDEAYSRDHSEVKPGPYVMLAVSDTGSGMDAETQKRIFEPFFTTKEKGKGTGLGLAMVYGIVRQSGGNIWVYSELNMGTVFKLYFPRNTESEEAATAQPAHAQLGRGSETILLVEDEEALRMMVQSILERRGYKVLAPREVKEALALSENHQGPIHLLLTDVVMPKMSGRELAEQVTSRHPDTKVIYMSGYTNDAIVQHGVLESDMTFLQKPFSPDTVVRKVREMLDRN